MFGQAVSALNTLTKDKYFKRVPEYISGTIRNIQFGQALLITLAAATTAGAVAPLAGVALKALQFSETAIAVGVFATNVTVFTATSYTLNAVFLGKEVSTRSFLHDLAWNTVMFGALSGAGALYEKGVVRLIGQEVKGLQGAQKYVYNLGKLATIGISMQVVGELEFAADKGRLMTGGECLQSVVQNTLMFIGLEIGQYATRPLQERLSQALVAKVREQFAADYAKLDEQRTALLNEINKFNADPTKVDVTDLAPKLLDLWNKQLELLNKATEKGFLTPEEAAEVKSSFGQERLLIELRLAQFGVEIPGLFPGESAFRKAGVGTIEYDANAPGALEALKAYYDKVGGQLVDWSSLPEAKDSPWAKVPGAKVGKLPNGGLTFYLPKGMLPPKRVVQDVYIVGKDGKDIGQLDVWERTPSGEILFIEQKTGTGIGKINPKTGKPFVEIAKAIADFGEKQILQAGRKKAAAIRDGVSTRGTEQGEVVPGIDEIRAAGTIRFEIESALPELKVEVENSLRH